ncbi:DNA-3-methyladenine glycosylase family protein [Aurantibacter aestuarii]|uniref:DNA-3-methyladenine glycosylase II n=1 Tax=Aurantibacter aestuarii TaxID=1266046 RepID=A0A2T1NCE0_9FLAO|nr:DNA-3-methyladenine glycosylase [Aurantibacter aestuarii]PSG90098.1 DNA-3-methyladenine glycosylase 2 family protein [Aurantibacter aestuarii]
MTPIVNSTDIHKLIALDPVFKSIYETHGTPENYERAEGFETLCRIILEQQVSLASAKAHYLKLKNHISIYTPEQLLKLSDVEFKNCFISKQKATYLRALSNAILTNQIDLSLLSSLSEAEIRLQLTAIKGIGSWTADVYLMFCLQHKNIFPIGDIAIRQSIKTLYQIEDREVMIQRAETWKPYQSLACYFLWHFYLKSRNRPVIT